MNGYITVEFIMHAHIAEYPPAPTERVAEAEKIFPYRSISPEEYAAREGQNWVCFSFDDYIYPSPELNEWIHSLGDILFTKGRLRAAQKKYLPQSELAQIEKQSSTW
jgi:hypothetical protein